MLHFASPKVQASVGANTYAARSRLLFQTIPTQVISGHAENKKLEEPWWTSSWAKWLDSGRGSHGSSLQGRDFLFLAP